MKKLIIIIIYFILSGSLFAQWSVISNIPGVTLTSVKFFNDSLGFIGAANGVWKSTNGGVNWSQVMTGGSLNSMCFIDSLNGFGCGSPGRIYKTSDGGQNWSTYILTQGFTGIYSISFFNINTGVSVGFNGIVQRTTNSGINWVLHDSTYFMEQAGVSAHVSGFALVAGGAPFEQVNKSTNFGNSWSGVGFNTMGALYGAYVVNANLGFVCGFAGRIRRTTDTGITWTRQDSMTSRTLRSVYFSDANTGTIVGDAGTILHTSNSGINWYIEISGTTNNLTSVCFINGLTGWAVGSGGIVLKTTNGGITFVNTGNNSAPNAFSLSQNYPNPFNPSTTIKFDVPAVGTVHRTVRLTIYDALGREVAVLVNEQLKPGTYETEWDGSNFASGIYFYSLQTEEFFQTKKMILMK